MLYIKLSNWQLCQRVVLHIPQLTNNLQAFVSAEVFDLFKAQMEWSCRESCLRDLQLKVF